MKRKRSALAIREDEITDRGKPDKKEREKKNIKGKRKTFFESEIPFLSCDPKFVISLTDFFFSNSTFSSTLNSVVILRPKLQIQCCQVKIIKSSKILAENSEKVATVIKQAATFDCIFVLSQTN